MDYLRSKQAGVQGDFTGTLASSPDVFELEEVANFGLSSTVSAISYDPVQSLLAIGTHEHETIPGTVHVFGQKRVHVQFPLPRKASIKFLRLCDARLIVVDSKNELTIFSLEDPGARGVSYSPPGVVTALETDSCLDWAFLGLQNGEVVAYDLDRQILAPLRIPNFWRERSPKARLLSVVSLQLHPKDVGTLLIGYLEGAVLYSFKQNAALHYLEFTLPPGAPGADTELAQIRTTRKPRVSQALWHPTGTFVCTTHEDSVIAVWNPKDGRIVQARTIQDAYVHLPGRANTFDDGGGGISIRQPIFKAAWCSTSNPDETSLLISGGNSMTMPAKGMTLFDLGPSPNMLTSSAQVVSEHFATPRRQRLLPTPTELDVVDFVLIPRSTPHYGGTHDPLAVIAVLASGEITTLRFPDGAPLSPAMLLHPSLSLSHPFPTSLSATTINRQRWLGMSEVRRKDIEIVIGGVEHKKLSKRFESRTLALSAHPDGVVRVWDLGHADEVENEDVIELDVGRALQRGVDLKIECACLSSATGETAVGMETGQVVVFRWGKNKAFARSPEDVGSMDSSQTSTEQQETEGLVDIKMRADPDLGEGLLPYCLLDQKCGSAICIKMSDLGFLAVGYQTGHICVVDLRGPTVIEHSPLPKETTSKRTSFHHTKRASASTPLSAEKPTTLEFAIMSLEDDTFSSLTLLAGTSHGRIITYQIVPSSSGQGFTVNCRPSIATSSTLGPILSIHALDASTGHPADATQAAFAALKDGRRTPAIILATNPTEIKLFKPPAAKGAHKSLDFPISSAGLVRLDGYGAALATKEHGTPKIVFYSLPGLKELSSIDMAIPRELAEGKMRVEFVGEGYVFMIGESWCRLLSIFGAGGVQRGQKDILYNPNTPALPRPTISNLQWLAGTQYISTSDLDLLVGGADRPLSNDQKQQLRQEQQAAQQAERARGGSDDAAGGGGEGVWGSMVKGLHERTEKLNFANESMDKLGQSSAQLADDVSKFVKKKQREAAWGGIKSKFF